MTVICRSSQMQSQLEACCNRDATRIRSQIRGSHVPLRTQSGPEQEHRNQRGNENEEACFHRDGPSIAAGKRFAQQPGPY